MGAEGPRVGAEADGGRERLRHRDAAALVKEARSAVMALAGPPLRLTLAALVESALRRELERLGPQRMGRPPTKRSVTVFARARQHLTG